jgi:hypothetical protein
VYPPQTDGCQFHFAPGGGKFRSAASWLAQILARREARCVRSTARFAYVHVAFESWTGAATGACDAKCLPYQRCLALSATRCTQALYSFPPLPALVLVGVVSILSCPHGTLCFTPHACVMIRTCEGGSWLQLLSKLVFGPDSREVICEGARCIQSRTLLIHLVAHIPEHDLRAYTKPQQKAEMRAIRVEKNHTAAVLDLCLCITTTATLAALPPGMPMACLLASRTNRNRWRLAG